MASTMSLAMATPVAAIARKSARATSSNRVPSQSRFSGLRSGSRSTPVLCAKKSVDEEFAAVYASCKATKSGGGALTTSCDLASEIFGLVPIMGGLVLTGVAIGFVLLRIEAAVEESAE